MVKEVTFSATISCSVQVQSPAAQPGLLQATLCVCALPHALLATALNQRGRVLACLGAARLCSSAARLAASHTECVCTAPRSACHGAASAQSRTCLLGSRQAVQLCGKACTAHRSSTTPCLLAHW